MKNLERKKQFTNSIFDSFILRSYNITKEKNGNVNTLLFIAKEYLLSQETWQKN